MIFIDQLESFLYNECAEGKMEKLDFSDFHKFLVSIGIILIGLGMVFLWLFASLSIDEIFYFDNFYRLIPAAKSLALIKLETLQFFGRYRYIISIVLIALGFLITCFGLFPWKKKQNISDQQQILEFNKLLKKSYQAPDGKIKQNVEKDLKGQQPVGRGGGGEGGEEEYYMELARQEEIKEYSDKENTVINKLIDIFDDYLSYKYYFFDGSFVDLFLKSEEKNQPDLIFEIVMVRSDMSKDIVINKIENFKRTVSIFDKRLEYKIDGCFIMIYEEMYSPPNLFSNIEDLNTTFNEDRIFISLLTLNEIFTLSKKFLRFRITTGYNFEDAKG